MTLLKRKDIIFTAKDWKGRDVILDRQTLLGHVARFHYDQLFIVDSLKRNLAKPKFVYENRKNQSENAVYEIANGDHPCLLVAIKIRGLLQRRMIATFYGVKADHAPTGRLLWPKGK